jgi:intracellular multiplication protein IcmP
MPPQQGQQGTDENGALWIAGAALVVILVAWFTLHAWIVLIYLKIKLYELYLLNPFTHRYQDLTAQLSALTLEAAKQINASTAFEIGATVGDWLRYPLVAILVVAALLLYFGSVATRFRSTYSMQRLASEEAVDWPQISPVVPLDLVDTPLDKGPWAFSLNPMLFAKKHDLLIIEKEAPFSYELASAIKIKMRLKKFEAKQVFLMQLGNYWHSPEKLPMHVRALLAMFAAKAHSDDKIVTRLNNQIATSATKSNSQNIDYSGIDALLAKYYNEKDVQQTIQQHAFVYTVMAAMLQLSRKDGVYASSDFLWLKPIDRRLWYTLNTVGRKTAFPEVGGIFAHFEAELMYHKPLFVPMVDEAVEALEIALSEILFKPSDDEVAL